MTFRPAMMTLRPTILACLTIAGALTVANIARAEITIHRAEYEAGVLVIHCETEGGRAQPLRTGQRSAQGTRVQRAVTLDGGKNSLFDNDGSSLVIHAKADDYRSQPSGDAGDRLACAVIQR